MSSKCEHNLILGERILSINDFGSFGLFIWIYLTICSKCGQKVEIESYKNTLERALQYPESIIEYE